MSVFSGLVAFVGLFGSLAFGQELNRMISTLEKLEPGGMAYRSTCGDILKKFPDQRYVWGKWVEAEYHQTNLVWQAAVTRLQAVVLGD